MVTVILKVVEMTLLKYPTWGESFPKIMHMLIMIMNEQQTMPYYLTSVSEIYAADSRHFCRTYQFHYCTS